MTRPDLSSAGLRPTDEHLGVLVPHPDLATARSQHQHWMLQLMAFIEGGNQEQADTIFRSPQQCKLGLWIKGAKKELCRCPSLDELHKTHANVHKIAVELIDLCRHDEMTRAYDEVDDFEIASHALILALDQIEAEIARAENKT